MKKLIVKIVILVVAFSLIILGVINQEGKSVLFKAINICLECIGIG